MKKNKKIINDFKKKIKNLRKHNQLYYLKDKPQISDAVYDQLKKDLLELEKKNPYLKNIDSVEKIVGAPPSNKFKKIKHLLPMLSLSNAFNEADMINFLKRLKTFK